jgi:hypothetical protein
MMPDSSVLAVHVVFEVTNYKRAICVQGTCALYETFGEELPKGPGHSRPICPRAECQLELELKHAT